MIKVIYEFYYWKPLREVYPHAKWYQVIKYRIEKYLRKIFVVVGLVGFLAGFGMGMYKLGIAVTESQITYAYVDRHIEVPTREVPPVMKRIAKCESGDKHFDSRGNIIVNTNGGHSTDYGRYQINEFYWGKKAKELGLDIKKEKDNEKMAMWMYEQYGSVPWIHSAHCWNR